MSYAFDKILQKEFPTVFPRQHGLPDGVSPGWYEIIWDISKALQQWNEDLPPEQHVHAAQIKEKFGGLRYYYDAVSTPEAIREKVHLLVSNAEELSYATCENCGYPGQAGATKTGWAKTLCKTCGLERGHKPFEKDD